MAKLQIKSETIATYGGIFKIMELFEQNTKTAMQR